MHTSFVIAAGAARVELRRGDCLAEMSRLERGSVSVIATSPPYNLGIKYASGYDDAIPRADYLRWTRLWLTQALRVLDPMGSLFLNIAGKPVSPWGPFEVLLEARAAGWHLQNTLYWVKSFTDADGESIGHFKPLNSGRYVNDCAELVFHLTPTGETPIDKLAVGVPYVDKSNLTRDTRGKNGDLRCRGNVWVVPYETIKSREKDRPHPATFPPELAMKCFKLHGLERIRMTLDPFSGLGSTARAAARLGLNHLGIELGASDVEESARRVREELGTIVPAPEPAALDPRRAAATEF
jgi:site-specific DNA-methyltransferase (adenine-specific)